VALTALSLRAALSARTVSSTRSSICVLYRRVRPPQSAKWYGCTPPTSPLLAGGSESLERLLGAAVGRLRPLCVVAGCLQCRLGFREPLAQPGRWPARRSDRTCHARGRFGGRRPSAVAGAERRFRRDRLGIAPTRRRHAGSLQDPDPLLVEGSSSGLSCGASISFAGCLDQRAGKANGAGAERGRGLRRMGQGGRSHGTGAERCRARNH
jgi:hypothetical protein